MKKAFAILLSLALMLSLAVPAMAADDPVPGPFDVTINNATGHTYKIYQIFTGDLAKDATGKEILSNIKYGDNYGTKGEKVPEDVLTGIKNGTITITPTGDGITMTTTGDVAKIEDRVAGYYMIVDVTDPLPGQDTRSAVMFQVVGDTTITSKHIGTTIVKKVQDVNDTTGKYTDKNGDYADTAGNDTWIDSADYDIDDIVPFKSTANFEGLDNYETYKVIFTDIMAKGLTYNGDMKVSVNGEDKTAAFTITTATCTDSDEYKDGTVITVTCDDITALTDANAATIVLEYTATLNEFANLGAAGNPNKIKVTTQPDGTGETLWDVNIVFTYKVEANKYANEVAEGKELTGAGFTLYKWIKDDSGAGGAWVKIGTEVKGEEMTKFEWKGIDDGKYKLEETTTPAGYNTIDPIEFEVVAEHVIVAENPTLTSLTGKAETGEISEITFTATGDKSSLSTDVVNKSGTILPETGGMGTTIFYIVGGIMVAAAVVLLITKKRMSAEG